MTTKQMSSQPSTSAVCLNASAIRHMPPSGSILYDHHPKSTLHPGSNTASQLTIRPITSTRQVNSPAAESSYDSELSCSPWSTSSLEDSSVSEDSSLSDNFLWSLSPPSLLSYSGPPITRVEARDGGMPVYCPHTQLQKLDKTHIFDHPSSSRHLSKTKSPSLVKRAQKFLGKLTVPPRN